MRIVSLLLLAAAVWWIARRSSGGRMGLASILRIVVAVLVAWVVLVLAFD